jgi:hypothetical protein
LGWLSEVGPTDFVGGIWVYVEGLVPSKRLWTIVHGLLYDLLQRVGYNGRRNHGPNVYDVNMPLAKSLPLQCCNQDAR